MATRQTTPIAAAILTAVVLPGAAWQTGVVQSTPPFAPFAATAEDFAPSWSPDGKQIVFARHQGRGINLYISSLAGGEPRSLLNNEHIHTQPDWSRDGRIVFSSNRDGRSEIWTMKADGTDLKPITNLPGGPNVQPRWSPDGKQVAFVAYPGPSVMVVPGEGGEPRRIAAGVWPAWSPDGKRLAYGATEVFGSSTHLAIRDLETGAETRPKSAPMASLNQQPDWSPDGRRILVVTFVDGVSRVQVLNLRDDRVESTTDGEVTLLNPHWSPDGSRMAISMTDTGHPPTIQIARPDGTDRRPVTTSRGYPTAKAITYQSNDGLAIPAYLFEPARCGEAKCPAIVWLHGGLGGLFGNTFDKEVQYFVEQGFVVLGANYRSSGGYGKDIAAVDATGLKEIEDVVGAVAYLRKQPTVDGAHIGAIGLSFGGLVTLLTVVRQPQLLAAAVDLYGPTDLTRWYKDAPNARAVLRIGFGGTPDEKPDAYRAASPVTDADRVRTPILIVHGDADADVPVSQAIEMADALRLAQKDYELAVIRGGDHGFVMSGLAEAMETTMRFSLARLPPPSPKRE